MRVEEVGAKKWTGHIGEDELVGEIGAGEVEMPGRRSIRHYPGPVGGTEGTQALGVTNVAVENKR